MKTTDSKLFVYSLTTREFVFSKTIGDGDGYNITFVNENQIITGDWMGNNILLDLKTFQVEKFLISDIGMCRFLVKDGKGYFICHLPKDENKLPISFGDYNQREIYQEKLEILLLNEQFNTIKTLLKIDTPFAAILNPINFTNGKLYVVCLNMLRIFDIENLKEDCFCFDEIIMFLSISKKNKFVFVSSGFKGCLLDCKLEKIADFENSNQMQALTATFFDDESKILINSNGKASIYKL